MNREECILFSGAAQGTEAEFGAAAERYGIEEVNFTFPGHSDARRRGIRVLSDTELAQGDVSLSYVSRLMHRRYPDTPLFKKVLQTIWHQVNNAREIFVVGKILPDATVQGGTGVGAEYAKFFNKPLFVFDQTKGAWLRWTGDAWEPAADPVITQPRFAGTGTRFLEDNGRAAIEGLFARTFPQEMSRTRRVLLWVMGLFYIGAGIIHFVNPGFYLPMMPPSLPFHLPLVYLSGLVEIVLGAAVLVPGTQRLAAWGIIVLLIAIFPANLHIAMHDVPLAGATEGAGVWNWVRLPLQGVLIWWAWQYTRAEVPSLARAGHIGIMSA